MKKSITLQNINFGYKASKPIINDVSISINEGECIGIIGPNGSGKTTLLKILVGLIKPTHGSVKIFNKNISQMRNIIGWVPQHFNFDSDIPISAIDVVLTGRLHKLKWHGQYTKEDYKIALESLEQTDLLDLKNHCFSKLSGGQAQRVLIARAMASHPKILILDEPTANIDIETQKKIYTLLEKIKKDITTVMITHDFHHASKLFSRAFCLNGSIKEIPHSSFSNLCKHFIFTSNEI